MRRGVWRAVALVCGTTLALALLWVAQPESVFRLIAGLPLPTVAAAFGLHLAILALRGWRLKALSQGRLSGTWAFLLFTASQAASAILPGKLGEMALPPLARWALRARITHGAFWWAAGRFFDLFSLALAVSVLTLGGLIPIGLLGPGLLLLSTLTTGALLASRRRTWHWTARFLPSRRWVRGALRVRRLLVELRRDPRALVGVLVLSLLSWASIVAFTGLLCLAMRGDLTWRQILLGVLGATLGAAVPLATFGNLGPLQAGFASALSLTGVPPAEALALGFAVHFWTLAFALALGIPSLAILTARAKTP